MRWHDEHGMVGKIIVVWLLVVALLAVVVIDAGTILFANVKTSDAAQTAASTGASTYRSTHDETRSCQAALDTLPDDVEWEIPEKGFCKIDADGGAVTIKIRLTADTMLAGRLGMTRELTEIEAIETGRPSAL